MCHFQLNRKSQIVSDNFIRRVNFHTLFSKFNLNSLKIFVLFNTYTLYCIHIYYIRFSFSSFTLLLPKIIYLAYIYIYIYINRTLIPVNRKTFRVQFKLTGKITLCCHYHGRMFNNLLLLNHRIFI